MKNKIIITNCHNCANWLPVDKFGRGSFCSEVKKEVIPENLIPDWCPKLNKKSKKCNCEHCSFISKTFPPAVQMTNREYWLMTEVFVYLHGGKDYCISPKII